MAYNNLCPKCGKGVKYHYTSSSLCHWCFARALVPKHIPDDQVDKYRELKKERRIIK